MSRRNACPWLAWLVRSPSGRYGLLTFEFREDDKETNWGESGKTIAADLRI